LPVWQALYEELRDNNFEIVSVAEDSKGPDATREWITATPLTYTALIDEAHVVSKRYNMLNVPTGVWIDESGNIVRPNEVAFADNRHQDFTGQDAIPYIDAIRDWVRNGTKSPYVMDQATLREKLSGNDSDALLATAEFGLAEQLQRDGYTAQAILHFKEAQRLNPRSWNYKRQAYALGNAERDYATTFMDEVKKIGGPKKYYPPALAEL
jgi:hypothetical protein